MHRTAASTSSARVCDVRFSWLRRCALAPTPHPPLDRPVVSRATEAITYHSNGMYCGDTYLRGNIVNYTPIAERSAGLTVPQFRGPRSPRLGGCRRRSGLSRGG